MDENNRNEIDFKSLENVSSSNESSSYRTSKLTRSKDDFILTGTCGGVAKYLKIDPVFLRILLILSIFFGGWGIVVYVVASFLLPPDQSSQEISSEEKQKIKRINNRTFLGGILLFVGLYIMISNLGLIFYVSPFNLSRDFIIPLFALLISLYLVVHRKQIENEGQSNLPEKLSCSLNDKKFFGICGGFALYLGVDVLIIRILWILVTYVTAGIGLLVYMLLFIILKSERKENENPVS